MQFFNPIRITRWFLISTLVFVNAATTPAQTALASCTPGATLGNDTINCDGANETIVFDADANIGNDTLQDSGGTDTLNYSSTTNTSRHLTLDLGSNDLQTVVPGYHSLTILPGTIIENVTGGRGNDTIIGNSANNALNGGIGNDSLLAVPETTYSPAQPAMISTGLISTRRWVQIRLLKPPAVGPILSTSAVPQTM